MKKYLFAILIACFSLKAEKVPEEIFQSMTRAIQAISPQSLLHSNGTCLQIHQLYQATIENLPQIETIIFNAMQYPSRAEEFLTPYLRLWVLGRLGPEYFDLMIPNSAFENLSQIEDHIYLAGVYTHKENGKIYWIPLLIDTDSQTITLLSWENSCGKCYRKGSTFSSSYGICGKWTWNEEIQQVISFCSCNDRDDCGVKNFYVIQAGNLVLMKSMRKRKCDGKPFDDYAKQCCSVN